MIVVGNAYCLSMANKIWAKFINYYQLNHLVVVPESKKINQDGKDIIEYNIDNLKEKNIEEDNLENYKIAYPEYNFDASGNEPNINEDLLYNFECSENVFAEGNRNYYKKKKDKKNKKKKKKNNYYK